MSTLMQASNQWMNRPADERFTSLTDMVTHFERVKSQSHAAILPSKQLEAVTAEGDVRGLSILAPNGQTYAPTHWAFGQLAQLGGAPANYLRTLPSPMAADCINFGLQVARENQDVQVLTYMNGAATLRAATGPMYGRIWNLDILRAMVAAYGNGIDGQFRVPGEFGKRVEVTKSNTTLYAGDRDMFVFLADEDHRIEIADRRDGQAGSLARGFFVWNSEVGSTTFGIATFLFDYVCCNRIVWGAQEYNEIRIRHSAKAPERFIEEIKPALLTYAQSSTRSVTDAIEKARATKIADGSNQDERDAKVAAFLANRKFGKRVVETIMATHQLEENRPIETLWDATTAITAYARSQKNQDERVALERIGGDVMALAA